MQFNFFRSSYLYGVRDPERVRAATDAIADSVQAKGGVFVGDAMVVWGRNLGFLDDAAFTTAWTTHAEKTHEKGIIWRTAVLVWAARQALRREGDFVECGSYRGTTARILLDAVNLTRPFYLYDMFENPERALPDHGADLEAFVRDRFAPFPNVVITKGRVPETLANAPEKIAFLHIDMNSVEPEIAALEALFDRMTPGGVVVLDDYGHLPYRRQHLAERAWFAARGVSVLEIPTGQGVVIA